MLSTANAALDQCLGGGIRPGCVTEICGRHNTGKTTVCLRVIESARGRGVKSVVVDSQHDLCFAMEETTTINVTTVEGLVEALSGNISQVYGLVVVDCLPMLCEHYPTLLAKSIAMHKLNLSLQSYAKRNGAAVVVVNCTSDRVGDNESRMGGAAWVHAPSVIVHLRRSEGDGQLAFAVMKV